MQTRRQCNQDCCCKRLSSHEDKHQPDCPEHLVEGNLGAVNFEPGWGNGGLGAFQGRESEGAIGVGSPSDSSQDCTVHAVSLHICLRPTASVFLLSSFMCNGLNPNPMLCCRTGLRPHGPLTGSAGRERHPKCWRPFNVVRLGRAPNLR